MSAHWINRERLRNYPRILLVLYVGALAALVLLSRDGVDRYGRPLGVDFIAFWCASKLALSGTPSLAYDIASIAQLERSVVPGIDAVYPWLYPPTYYLMILPLSLLPYFFSLTAFLGTSLLAYVAVIRRIVAVPGSLMVLFGFSGVLVNLVQGQNGFLTAALIGAGLLLLRSRPLWAGVLIGLLTIKPHLGLLLPVALLSGRQWRAFLSASLTAVLFLACGVTVLGVDTVSAFWSGLSSFSRLALGDPRLMSKVPTVFSLVYGLQASARLAWTIHAVVALGVTAAVAWVWSTCRNAALCSAAVATGALLVSPYVLDYDLVWLGLPMAWLAACGLKDGWLSGEREVLLAAWLLPLLTSPLAKLFHTQPGALGVLALFAAIVRRVRLEQSAPAVAA